MSPSRHCPRHQQFMRRSSATAPSAYELSYPSHTGCLESSFKRSPRAPARLSSPVVCLHRSGRILRYLSPTSVRGGVDTPSRAAAQQCMSIKRVVAALMPNIRGRRVRGAHIAVAGKQFGLTPTPGGVRVAAGNFRRMPSYARTRAVAGGSSGSATTGRATRRIPPRAESGAAESPEDSLALPVRYRPTGKPTSAGSSTVARSRTGSVSPGYARPGGTR